MDVAAMSPRELALPIAVAHLPTTAAALVVATVSVTVVDADSVTVMEVGAVDALALGRPWRRVPWTVTVEPETELTVPAATARASRGVPVGAPLGRGAPVPPPPGPPHPGPPPKPPPNPPRTAALGQAPLTLAWIRTDVAVSDSAEPVPGVPVTVTHSPAARLPVTVWVKRVVEVYVTVV
jgi:hypothetical protein